MKSTYLFFEENNLLKTNLLWDKITTKMFVSVSTSTKSIICPSHHHSPCQQTENFLANSHVDDLREVHPRRDLLVKSSRVFKPFQMERGNNRQFLQCQLLGALLVPVTVRAADLGHAAEMLGLSESLETVLETDGVCDGGEVEGYVPKRVDGGGDPLADLAHHVTL